MSDGGLKYTSLLMGPLCRNAAALLVEGLDSGDELTGLTDIVVEWF